MENNIKKFIGAKSEENYLKGLKDGIKGYSGFTTFEFIAYLNELQRRIHAINITTIQSKMKELFNIAKGMKMYIKDMEYYWEQLKT